MAEKKILRAKARCKICDGWVDRRHGPQTYCSPGCRSVDIRARDNQRRRDAGGAALMTEIPCAGCGVTILFDHPSKRYCVGCRKVANAARGKRYRQRHPDRVSAHQTKTDLARKDSPVRREAMRRYGKARDDKQRDCPRRRMDRRISEGVRIALKGRKAGRKWEAILGYNLDDLVRHLERQFTKGMGWHNMGEWHIDHIVPKASFSYTSEMEPDFKAAWALTNLRPLWAKANIAKKDRRLFLV